MKRATAWLAAAGAVAYLAVMAYSGALPQRGQHVKFEARGLLVEDPQRVESVVLSRSGTTRTFVRAGGRWQENGRALAEPAASALDEAVKFMHTSAPVRSIALKDLEAKDAASFGLAPPRFTVRLTVGGAAVLDAGFGGTNPAGRLSYVGVIGRDQLYLLSHFVVEQWDQVIASTAP